MATQKIPGRAIKIGTDTIGDVMYFDGSAWTRLPIGEPGDLLIMNAAGTLPEWRSFEYQGSQFGYAVMGQRILPGGTSQDLVTIEKFSYASDTDAVDHCDAFTTGSHQSCCRSNTYGYANGGEQLTGGDAPPAGPTRNRITKFSFASTANGTDVGDLLQSMGSAAGHSSGRYGYVSGGGIYAQPYEVNTIQKYSVTADLNSTDVGDLTFVRQLCRGANSVTHGYTLGGSLAGWPTTSSFNNIEKFSFDTDGNSTDIANLTDDRGSGSACSSYTHGYLVGGVTYVTPGDVSAVRVDIIDKFTFASDSDATDVGNLSRTKSNHGGSSSTTHGYIAGGSGAPYTEIEKFPFASDSNASIVASLNQGRHQADGTQN